MGGGGGGGGYGGNCVKFNAHNISNMYIYSILWLQYTIMHAPYAIIHAQLAQLAIMQYAQYAINMVVPVQQFPYALHH